MDALSVLSPGTAVFVVVGEAFGDDEAFDVVCDVVNGLRGCDYAQRIHVRRSFPFASLKVRMTPEHIPFFDGHAAFGDAHERPVFPAGDGALLAVDHRVTIS